MFYLFPLNIQIHTHNFDLTKSHAYIRLNLAATYAINSFVPENYPQLHKQASRVIFSLTILNLSDINCWLKETGDFLSI